MRKLGVLKTKNGMYKIMKQEKGHKSVGTPRCPLKIYEKDVSGGWSHLETLDAETPRASKNSFTEMEDDNASWNNAIEAIRFYDESEIVGRR